MTIHEIVPITNPNGGIYQSFPLSPTSVNARWFRVFFTGGQGFIGDASVTGANGVPIQSSTPAEFPFVVDPRDPGYDLSLVHALVPPLGTVVAEYVI